ncbi:lysine-sensitive aspartokinase 3 [Photobacterium aphoticum]|uniref:Aspartokinase n=1 Tax=Photobacterium aphoticum TaxID=754436 RepID=A0A090RFL0_9GAMM|nr:lysine-sensitive aspartokinase 3 [Photobacterium aphoticum]KLV02737.1 aspartate kinase [Photobacterium aphoticum]PSU54724.1 lysine-sensitive aspartokinase 3 [Photobacterium aphoticum]GAL06357.1 aspartokinase [Photobacterium aphoticum]GHA54701.1 aspartate kinase [Photobacterium aphoticum]
MSFVDNNFTVPPPITVAKFGGTSVADHAAMSLSATIIKNNPQAKVVLISACSGVTNLLVELANGIADNEQRSQRLQQLHTIHQNILNDLAQPDSVAGEIHQLLSQVAALAEEAVYAPSIALTDQLVAHGELLSTFLFTQILNEMGAPATRFDIRPIMRTDSQFGKAVPDVDAIRQLADQHLQPLLNDTIIVSQGFIGSNEQGQTTTLGRGGSDYSAALVAEAIQAETLEIWTDVPGMYSTDPRITANAKPIKEISFSEASEMANFGAKILHPSTLLPAVRQKIPVFIGSSKAPEQGGTWIRQHVAQPPKFRALALRCNQTMVTLTSLKMFQAYGFLSEVFRILAEHKVSVDLITTSEVSVSLTLDQTDTGGGAPNLPAAATAELSKLCRVEVEQNLCLVALIGNKLGDAPGAATQVFGALEQYSPRMICFGASAHNLCFLVNTEESRDVVKTLHKTLFE